MPTARKKPGKSAPKASFSAKLGADGFFIDVPVDVRAVFGRARPPVRVTIAAPAAEQGTANGYTFRTTLSVYDGVHKIPMRREHREAARVDLDTPLRVTLELDTAPRTVKAPPALAAALKKNKKAAAAWDKLSYSHKKEHADAIADAKKPATRERRVAAAIAMLLK